MFSSLQRLLPKERNTSQANSFTGTCLDLLTMTEAIRLIDALSKASEVPFAYDTLGGWGQRGGANQVGECLNRMGKDRSGKAAASKLPAERTRLGN
jgi:hypothetical protein